MMDITAELIAMSEPQYGDFQAGLVPNIDRSRIIGIRVPIIRRFAKKLKGTEDVNVFFKQLPHRYYEENLLHIICIEDIDDYDECIAEIERFLPYMDCWAVTDDRIPKVLAKHRKELIGNVVKWINSEEPYVCRYGLHMLMSQYLDDDFRPEYNACAAAVRSDEYYVNMMVAWYFATALAKQWDATIDYINQERLDKWTHNKTIQKAVESFRVSDEHKKYLKSRRIK